MTVTSPDGPRADRPGRSPDSFGGPVTQGVGEASGAGSAAEGQGLTAEEAARRLVTFGANRVAVAARTPVWRRVVGEVRDPLVMVLLVAAALTVATGDWADAIIIGVVVVVNTTVGVVQQVRADGAIAALSSMSAPRATVLRDGAAVSISAEQVVPGDVVLLAEGDIVPADARLLEAAALLADESVLTGESVPVEKSVPGQPGLEQSDGVTGSGSEAGCVIAGTVIVHGRGTAVVTATGARTALGGIAALMTGGSALTPLQHRMAELGRALAAVATVLSVVVAAIGLLRGQPLELMLVTAVSLVVAAVPESLPAVVTLGLAVGARRMSTRHAIVRRLPAIETLGAITVLATDKTGTLTAGQMVVEQLWTPVGQARLTGLGYGPDGTVRAGSADVTAADRPDLEQLLSAGVLCNDASVQAPTGSSGSWTAVGDPTEAALLAAAAKLGLHREALEGRVPRIAEVPFDSGRRRMTTVHRLPDGSRLVVCKGAPEVVLTPDLLREAPELLERALAQARDWSSQGYRVLALATAIRPAGVDDGPAPSAAGPGLLAQEVDQGLTLRGLVAIADPPREAARQTVAALRAAGIIPVLITGDHVATAQALATRVGILDPAQQVVAGADLQARPGGDLSDVRVFARTSPTQKVAVVQALREAGHVVAMTGDGVNDGPALRQADIGVAMGRRGTEVARQAADLVLADDDLATLVGAVEEGRRVYDNIRRFLLYGLAGGLAEIVVMLAGPALGLALPLLPAQILWVNLLTHGLPGVAMGSEPVRPETIRRPPRPPAQSILGQRLWQRVVVLGVVVAAVSLTVGAWAEQTGRPWQSMLFVALGATQLGIAIGVRARPGTWSNPFLLWAVAAALTLQVAALYVPPLPELLGTTGLGPGELALAGCGAVVGYLAARLDGARHRAVRRAALAG